MVQTEPEINQYILTAFIVEPLFLVYFSVLVVAIVVSIILGRRFGSRYVLSHVSTTTMLGSLTVMSAKVLILLRPDWGVGWDLTLSAV